MDQMMRDGVGELGHQVGATERVSAAPPLTINCTGGATMAADDPTLQARFWARVKKADGDGCWEWPGWRSKDGYGYITVCGKQIRTHRLAWETTYGAIPEGMHVCHKCDNPPCVRPDHLFVGTHTDNMRDALRKGRVGAERKAGKPCPYGHEYTAENTRITLREGYLVRHCRACGARRARELWRRQHPVKGSSR